MIEVRQYCDKSVAVLGLGRSGIAAARALAAGGAKVLLWDDDQPRRRASEVAEFSLADLHETDFSDVAALVLSPGIPFTHPEPHPVVRRAQAAGCPVVGDIELFAGVITQSPIVGVTGTNGKSTTTALIGHILETCGRRVAVGGNLGTPALDLPMLDEDGTYVLELSSFQIDLAPGLVCDVAVLLNLSPDHLDRHGDMAGYIAVKKRLLAQQSATDTAVIGVDDEDCRTIFENARASQDKPVIPVGVGQAVDGGVLVVDGMLHDTIGPSSTTTDLRGIDSLLGAHNWQNAAAAIAVMRALGLSSEDACAALPSFPGLPHRMELIASIDGVRFVNDSKATNADATARALATFKNIYWIAGGIAKAGGIESLARYFPHIANAYLIGDAADAFGETLEGQVSHVISGTLDRALAGAFEQARDADHDEDPVVLLSPACASFDQFHNFEARGEEFRALVNSLVGEEQIAKQGGRC